MEKKNFIDQRAISDRIVDLGNRNTGNTTRKVDECIQNLFNNGYSYLYDCRSDLIEDHVHAFNIFQKRIESEHYGTKFTYKFEEFDGVWCYKIELNNL